MPAVEFRLHSAREMVEGRTREGPNSSYAALSMLVDVLDSAGTPPQDSHKTRTFLLSTGGSLEAAYLSPAGS